MLIHEWWGLNDQIKAVAADFAKQGYAALAVDLMDGKVASSAQQAQAQQAQQPLKGVVKAAVQEAHARTTCYKHTAASIAGLVHTGMTDTDRI